MNSVMAKIIDTAESRVEEKQTKATAAWLALVRDIAAEKSVTQQRVDDVLRDAGFTTEDLTTAVAVQEDRILRVAHIRAASKLSEGRPAIENQIEKIIAEFEIIQQRTAEAVSKLRDQISEIDQAEALAIEARTVLHRTCQDISLNAELAAVESQIATAQARLYQVNVETCKAQAIISSFGDQNTHEMGLAIKPLPRDPWQIADADRAAAAIIELSDTMKKIESEIKALKKSRDSLLDKHLAA